MERQGDAYHGTRKREEKAREGQLWKYANKNITIHLKKQRSKNMYIYGLEGKRKVVYHGTKRHEGEDTGRKID